jgi:DNA primase
LGSIGLVDAKAETEHLNKTPITRVGELLGYKLPHRGAAHCPFPDHEDKNPSFYVHPSGIWWKCFGCGRKGGSIDLVKEALGVDFLAARAWLRERVDSFNMWKVASTTNMPRRPLEKPHHSEQVLPADPEVLEAFLELAPLLDTGRGYLKARAIRPETAATFGVGQLSTNSDVLTHLDQRFGFSRLSSSGLLAASSTPRNLRLVFPRPSLIFPFREGGEAHYMQARYIGHESFAPRWSNLRGHRHRVYNVDVLASSAERIAICEGVTDTLSAIELGYQAVGLVGVSARFTEAQIKALRRRTVLLLLDWDARGEARSRELVAELAKFGVASVRLARPSATVSDLNEYLVELRPAS